MSRRMSCALTIAAVEARTKTVTRRHVESWRMLRPGDSLTLVDRTRGLRRGERQRVLAEVTVVDVRVEPLSAVTADECIREGFGELTPREFVEMWLNAHNYRGWSYEQARDERVMCRRIEWIYRENS